MRKITNLQTQTVTQQQRSPRDTYIRPALENTNRMGELADLLSKIAPVVRKYKDEADQAQYNKEVAAGYAASANFAPEEVPADKFYRYSSVNANEYAKRSRAFQHGVNIHEAQTLANTLPTAADEWFRTSQTADGRRISEIEDPVEFNRLYRKFTSDYIAQKSGGSLDPLLYEKYLGPSVTQVEHNVTQQFLSERRKAMENRAVGAFMDVFNSSVKNTFQTDAYFDNRPGFIANAAASLATQTDALASQIGPEKAGEALTTALGSLITDAETLRELSDIEQIARALGPTWSNAQNQLRFEKFKETATMRINQNNSHAEAEARRAEHERRQQQYDDYKNRAYTYMDEHPEADLTKFREDNPDMDLATSANMFREASRESREAKSYAEREVMALIVPPEEVEKMYQNKQISFRIYEQYKNKISGIQQRVIAPLAKQIAKPYLDADLPDELSWTKAYIQQAAYEYVAKAFANNNSLNTLFENDYTATPDVTSPILEQANKDMQLMFSDTNNIAKNVNSWRMGHERFSTNNIPDQAVYALASLNERCKTFDNPSDPQDLNDFNENAVKVFMQYCQANGSWPSYARFKSDLETMQLDINKFEAKLKQWDDPRYNSFRKFYENLVIFYIGGGKLDTNSASNPKPGTRVAGNESDGSSADNTNLEPPGLE